MDRTYFQRQLPEALAGLTDLAFDLRWNNCPIARDIWRRLDPEMWEHTENPCLVLQSAHQERINAAAQDESLLHELADWQQEIDKYYNAATEFQSLDPGGVLHKVAYFSMEFGLSEALPIYSGGLGMLAGDHLKTASDLGVPMVGIGLLYQQGYFRQIIGDDGKQLEAYPFNDPGSLPARPVTDPGGHWVRVRLPLPGRTLSLRVWKVQVGRVPLYLLDSNDALNTPWDRGITAQLYDAGRDKRLLQEIVLGVGGWRLLEELELDVDVCHLNEGHAAFAVLARSVGFSQRHNVPVRAALRASRGANVFTTHTPVEAAFDRFNPQQLARYAEPFLAEVGLPVDRVLALGRRNPDDESEPFNMAWLAMRGCCHINAVSQLHEEVSRDLFSTLFSRWPRQEIPIRSITNGVHVPTWASRLALQVWGDESGGWFWRGGLENVTERIKTMSSAELWTFRTSQRLALLQYVQRRCARPSEHGNGRGTADTTAMFDPNVLTIGFARRFAPYKRANLLLSDPERLKRMLLSERRPVQLIVAGKAHPNDGFGKQLVQRMTTFLNQPELQERAIFLEDYDMVLGQHLVAGVDVWLNTPHRPNEACGTSGMKVLVNGGLNVSILDGWWDEAMQIGAMDGPCPGWIVGSQESGPFDEMYRRDSTSLYDVLENEVIPEFYDHDEDGIPHRWVERVKQSMSQLTPQFSATRMLHDYVSSAYLPAAKAIAQRSADNAKLAVEILEWNDFLDTNWNRVRIGQVRCKPEDANQRVTVECWLDGLPKGAARLELYAENGSDREPAIVILEQSEPLPGSVEGYVFTGIIPADRPFSDFTVRVVPYHPAAFVPEENQHILWHH